MALRAKEFTCKETVYGSRMLYVDTSLGLNEENARPTTGYLVTLFGDRFAWKTNNRQRQ